MNISQAFNTIAAQHRVPALGARLRCASLIAISAACYALMTSGGLFGRPGGDFVIQWLAARALAAGSSPYEAVATSGWAWPYYYPGPAAVVTLLVAWMPLGLAHAVFAGISSGVLAFGVTRRYWWGLLIFLTPAFLHGFYHAQWAPLLVGAMLFPLASGLLVVKPSIGLAYYFARPSVRGAIVGSSLVLLSLAIRPSWPTEWREAISGASHIIPPLARPGGVFLLLALPFCRRADARLLVGLACVPTVTMLYETLPLFTVARSFRQMAMVVIFAAIGGWLILRYIPVGEPDIVRHARQWPFLLSFYYLPSLALVLYNSRRRVAIRPAIISSDRAT